jgi:hypothetical protein
MPCIVSQGGKGIQAEMCNISCGFFGKKNSFRDIG